MRLPALLLLVAICSAANAAAPTDIVPEAGPHAVGLRVVQQYDYSRVLEPQVDAFGKTGSAPAARPIQTLVWYPAKRDGGTPMTVADYRQDSLADLDFSVPAAALAKQRAAWLGGAQKAEYAAKTLALRGAAPAEGRYPVVIYAPSFASSAYENLDLCEYLASHGYVVIASPSTGARSPMMSDDIEGIEAQAADIAFLVNYAQTLPQADMTKVAAAGFSWGGMANVFASARSSRIKALVSLDGSIRYHPKVWSAASYVRPARTAVPMLFLAAHPRSMEELARDDKQGPSYLNSMKYSDVYIATMPPMMHGHFSATGLRFAGDQSFGDYQRADVLQAYRSGALYVREFLDAYLKDDPKALAFLREAPARHGIGPHTMTMDYHPASATAFGEGDFLRAFASGGFKDGQAIYTRMSAESADFKLSPLNLNVLGYQLLRAKNPGGAVELFKLAAYIEPKYGNAFDSQGEAYEALGETALAIAAYEKAVAVDKEQTNAMARIKALRAGTPLQTGG